MIPGSANPLLLKSAAAAGGYQIERSLRFNSSDSGFCSRTFGANPVTRTKLHLHWCVKRGVLGVDQRMISGYDGSSPDSFLLAFTSSDTLRFSVGGGGDLYTAAVFRDPSAWYIIDLAFDSTISSPSADRAKLWVNGTLQTWASGTVTLNALHHFAYGNSNNRIGCSWDNTSFCSLYLADIHFIDGQALTPSSFTEVSATTGQLIPKTYTGTFGTNGFWLKFSDNSNNTAATLGKDYSPNGNNWTPNNLSVTAGAGNDSLVDTPTSYGTDTGAGNEVRGNYCTWNPLDKGANVTLTNGNLDWSNSSAGNVRATVSFNGGKFYCEAVASTAGNYGFGIGKASSSLSGNIAGGITGVYAWNWNGSAYNFHSSGSYPWSASGSSSDVLQVAIDASNSASVKLFLGLQNTWYDSSGGTTANPATGANPTATLTDNVDWFLFTGGANTTNAVSVNMGARAFAYTAPSGFKALCDTNLPAPVVAKPNTLMDVALYTGNGSTQTISGLNFSPDLVWIKGRSSAQQDHTLVDAVRGVFKRIRSNTTQAEATETNLNVTAFNADGFSVGDDTNGGSNVNGSVGGAYSGAAQYVAWAWDAGTSTVSNTSGSITSQVRANVSAGFSVATFNSGSSGNKSFGHGLNVAPSLVLIKNRTSSGNWITFHQSAITSVNNYLMLDSTVAIQTGTNVWGTSLPDSSLVYFSSTNTVATNVDCVCYSFAPVVGYSSFGSFVGNGSATDGPMIATMFRPRWLMIKRTDSTSNWTILDAARGAYNVNASYLDANVSDAEQSNFNFADFLSNGFKIRAGNGTWNVNGGTYIYAAFAESPFQFSRAR